MKKSTILRTIFVCSFLLIAMLVYEISSNYGLSEKAVKTNATPITNKTIILDAGHGLPDERCSRFYWNDGASNKFRNSFEVTKVN